MQIRQPQKMMARIDQILSLADGDIVKATELAKANDKLDYQMLLAVQGRFEESWKVVKQLEVETPNCNRAAFNRGWHYLSKGMIKEGFELMESGRGISVWGSLNELGGMIQPQWNGEKLDGKFILVFLEGGFGDEIANVRFVKQLADMGAKVTVACNKGLVTLFSRVEGIHAIVQREVLKGAWHDYWFPGFSFPRLLEIKPEPYITADPKYIDKMSRLINSDKLKVGIRWRGNMAFEHQQFRRFPFEDFLGAVYQDVTLYSLQLSDCSDIDLKKHPQITDLEWALKSWDDTAGAIANLDLVITSCTSVAHLSAAMGKPTWVIVPILPYYIWAQAGNKSPWYESVTLYRQTTYNEWDEPLDAIRYNLKNL